MAADMTWWESFFDDDYARLWGSMRPPEHTAREVEGIWALARLAPGCRILDAPCGYGRISRALAERGASVVGVDQSEALLARAEQDRGDIDGQRLRYVRHDLREPLTEGGFDLALNIFSSLGYGTEDDDVMIIATLASAVRVGGRVLVETMHRDALAVLLARGAPPATRFPDGTLMVEEPAFDALSGRVRTTWYWQGPGGAGSKSAELRVYSATEMVRLVERAGLRFRSAHAGCSPGPFRSDGPEIGGRLAILAERP